MRAGLPVVAARPVTSRGVPAEKAPGLVTQTMIRYPEILVSANVEGEVVLEATIDRPAA